MKNEIEPVAAEWLARRAAGLTTTEENDFKRWLAADPHHATVYGELETTWRLLDGVRVDGEAGARPDPDALAPRWRRTARWWLPLAAAAVVALACPGWWQRGPAALPYTVAVATEVGDVRNLALPDGSVMRLNTATQVRVQYDRNERRVWLERGEAHFVVANNAARPFFVEAGHVAVRAVGTAFNVRLNAASVDVLVTEGRVRIDDALRGSSVLAPGPDSAAPSLSSGERAIVPTAPGADGVVGVKPVAPVSVTPDEVQRTLAWHERRIEFVATPLGEIVAEFNRYNRGQLRIADPRLAARRFGGSFRADDPAGFVRLLQTRFGVSVESHAGETTLREAPGRKVR